MHGTISSEGEVTVPVEVRERFGFAPDTAVTFEIREEGVLLRKDSPNIHPVDKVSATLPIEEPVDEILDETRSPRPGTA
jgi:bifunctional DNA-binding transcriptional regulator/antitoxin component of YhaV-PrlF toxin-antitoxin module